MQNLVLKPLGIADDLDTFRTAALDSRRGGFALQTSDETGHQTFIPLPFPLDTPQYEDTPPEGYGIIAAGPLWGSIRGFAELLRSVLATEGPINKLTGDPLFSASTWSEATADSLAKKGLSIKQPGFITATAPTALTIETYLQYNESSRGDNTVGWSLLQSIVARADVSYFR